MDKELQTEFDAWEAASDEVYWKYENAWNYLADGHTEDDIAIAAILRSIAREIESEKYQNWDDIKKALDYVNHYIWHKTRPACTCNVWHGDATNGYSWCPAHRIGSATISGWNPND